MAQEEISQNDIRKKVVLGKELVIKEMNHVSYSDMPDKRNKVMLGKEIVIKEMKCVTYSDVSGN